MLCTSAFLARGAETVVVEMFLHGGLHTPSPSPQAPAFAQPPSPHQYRGLWGDMGNDSHLKITIRRGDFFNPIPFPESVHGAALQTVVLAQPSRQKYRLLRQASCVTLAIKRGVSPTDGGRISKGQARDLGHGRLPQQ